MLQVSREWLLLFGIVSACMHPEVHWGRQYSVVPLGTRNHLYWHTHIFLYSVIFTPSIHYANPHYPSLLTESFSSPGHRKGSPAASPLLTGSKTPLPSSLIHLHCTPSGWINTNTFSIQKAWLLLCLLLASTLFWRFETRKWTFENVAKIVLVWINAGRGV